MRLIETLFESDEDRLIAKAKSVYKAFKKGRGMVKIGTYLPFDVSYELPDINLCEFEVRPSWDEHSELMAFITMQEPVKYKIHGIEDNTGEASEERLINRFGHDIGYVYRKKFDQFGVAIGEAF
jgi:hypothetical protein